MDSPSIYFVDHPTMAPAPSNNSTQAGKKKNNRKPKPKASAPAKVPAAVTSVTRSSQPKVTSQRGVFTVAHREVFAVVIASTSSIFTAALDTYAVNPGIAPLFPWLSALAINFASYSFKKLALKFRASAPTTTGGTFVMAFDPDPSNLPPGDIPSMVNLESSVCGSFYSPVTLNIPPKHLKALGGRKFVRSDAVPASSLPSFDAGSVYIYRGNASGACGAGVVEVDYVVDLFDPQPSEISSEVGSLTPGTGNSINFPLGAVPVPHGSAAVNCYVDTNLVQLEFLKSGTYLVVFYLAGTGSPNYSTIFFSGCTSAGTELTSTSTTVLQVLVTSVTVTASGQYMRFSAVGGTTCVNAKIWWSRSSASVNQ